MNALAATHKQYTLKNNLAIWKQVAIFLPLYHMYNGNNFKTFNL